MSHRFIRGKADQTLFIKKEDGELIVAQVYVDDIIFGSTKDEVAHGFLKLMEANFEMRMIGELTHFLKLQIHQQDSSILLSQSKYAKNLVKKFGLEFDSSVRTPMSLNVKFTVDLLRKSVNPSLYRSMIGVSFTLLLVDLTLAIVLECVQDIKLIPKNQISLL